MKKNTPQFLFVCVENSCRSQMAEGLFNALSKKATAISAGTKPSSLNPMAIEAMKDRGLNIADHHSKRLTPELVQNSFKVVTMGCIDECPFTPPDKTIKWNITDPKGEEKAFFTAVRDEIEAEIIELLKTYDL